MSKIVVKNVFTVATGDPIMRVTAQFEVRKVVFKIVASIPVPGLPLFPPLFPKSLMGPDRSTYKRPRVRPKRVTVLNIKVATLIADRQNSKLTPLLNPSTPSSSKKASPEKSVFTVTFVVALKTQAQVALTKSTPVTRCPLTLRTPHNLNLPPCRPTRKSPAQNKNTVEKTLIAVRVNAKRERRVLSLVYPTPVTALIIKNTVAANTYAKTHGIHAP